MQRSFYREAFIVAAIVVGSIAWQLLWSGCSSRNSIYDDRYDSGPPPEDRWGR